MNKRIIALFLAMVMIFSNLPLNAAALENTQNQEQTITAESDSTPNKPEEGNTSAAPAAASENGDGAEGGNKPETPSKPAETQNPGTSETKPEETEPEETKPEETEPEETKPEETKPEETKPEETQPLETQPEETQPQETQPEETEPEEVSPYADWNAEQLVEKYQQLLESGDEDALDAFLSLLTEEQILAMMELYELSIDPQDDKEKFPITEAGGVQKDVWINGERRTIYCLQYDYLWPTTKDDAANSKTEYWEASEDEMLLSSTQLAVLQRVLFAGYPYDSVGALKPIYDLLGSFGDDMAADMTQAVIWTLMAKWGVPGNLHYDWQNPTDGMDEYLIEAFNALMDYAENGAVYSLPESFSPSLSGNTTFRENNTGWISGPHRISDPDHFDLKYQLTVPEGVTPVDSAGNQLGVNYNSSFEVTGYVVYGDTDFYLTTDDPSAVAGKEVTFTVTAKVPSDVQQLSTTDTGKGDKHDGQGYIQHKYQTMVSVGITAKTYSGSATLNGPAQAEPVDIHLSGSKTLEGRDLKDGEFTFTITGPDDYTETVSNTADGEISFTKLHFTKAGTYNYTVVENVNSDLADKGITFDSKVYHFTVTVTDIGDGHLTAELSGDSLDGSDLDFVNEYKPNSTSIVFPGTKTLEDFPDNAVVAPEFTFVLKEGNNEIDTVKVKVRDNKATAFAFKSITYTQAGVHHYTVSELQGRQSGVTYSKEHYQITVTVTDNGEGALAAEITDFRKDTEVQDEKVLAFTNVYEAAPVEVPLSGTKTLTGRTLAAEEFSFVLKDSDGKVLQTVKNSVNGTISFTPLTFDKVGVYTYTVEEKKESLPGVTYDTKVYGVTVTVVDVGDGRLHAAVSGDTNGANLNFTNVYSTGSLKISKRVTGNLGDKTKYFKFTITFDVDGEYPYTGSHTGTIKSGDTIKLKHGESITITGIPAGTGYTVKESDNSGYSVHKTGDKGVIQADKTASAAFTNSRSSVPKAGDDRNLLMWYAMMGICAAGAAVSLLLDRKKRNSRKYGRR